MPAVTLPAWPSPAWPRQGGKTPPRLRCTIEAKGSPVSVGLTSLTDHPASTDVMFPCGTDLPPPKLIVTLCAVVSQAYIARLARGYNRLDTAPGFRLVAREPQNPLLTCHRFMRVIFTRRVLVVFGLIRHHTAISRFGAGQPALDQGDHDELAWACPAHAPRIRSRERPIRSIFRT